VVWSQQFKLERLWPKIKNLEICFDTLKDIYFAEDPVRPAENGEGGPIAKAEGWFEKP
jgi:hypothetical protein